MTGPEYFCLEASGRPMLVIGGSYFYPRAYPSLDSGRFEGCHPGNKESRKNREG